MLRIRRVCNVVKCNINSEAAAWDGMKRAAEEKSGGTSVQSVERISQHTHKHTWNNKILRKSITKAVFWASRGRWSTLSPRLCRLAAVLRSQLLSIFSLLNLQPYQHMLDYMKPRFSVFNSCHRRSLKKSIETWSLCNLTTDKYVRQPASVRIRKCLKLRQKHLTVSLDGEKVRTSYLSGHTPSSHLHLPSFIQSSPSHSCFSSAISISPEFICWQQKCLKYTKQPLRDIYSTDGKYSSKGSVYIKYLSLEGI